MVQGRSTKIISMMIGCGPGGCRLRTLSIYTPPAPRTYISPSFAYIAYASRLCMYIYCTTKDRATPPGSAGSPSAPRTYSSPTLAYTVYTSRLTPKVNTSTLGSMNAQPVHISISLRATHPHKIHVRHLSLATCSPHMYQPHRCVYSVYIPSVCVYKLFLLRCGVSSEQQTQSR